MSALPCAPLPHRTVAVFRDAGNFRAHHVVVAHRFQGGPDVIDDRDCGMAGHGLKIWIRPVGGLTTDRIARWLLWEVYSVGPAKSGG